MKEPTLTENNQSMPGLTLADGRQLSFKRPLVMGVLNVTPDSFSDGGRFLSIDAALGQAQRMIDEGADIIDIGGESTRPGSDPTPANEEQDRVLPVIEYVHREFDTPVSIDTYNSATARTALDAGAAIVNDVSALRFDPDMASLVADRKSPVILMHMLGRPRNMQLKPRYEDCVREIGEFFEERIEYAESQGIERLQIILDPGIGFGKRLHDNLDILARLAEFTRFGRPVMVGASRKSFIEKLNPVGSEADERIGGSIAAVIIAVTHGASIVRVHDVVQTVTALRLLRETEERS
jgi:dihydropteroate synthase